MENKDILSRNILKYFAALVMIIDHVSFIFLSRNNDPFIYYISRTLGRIACPIMCYFIVEGFIYTSSKKRYLCRLLSCGIISQIPYSLAFRNRLFISELNIIITLFLCLLLLVVITYVNNNVLKSCLILIIFALSFKCDWGIIAPLLTLNFYIYRNNKKQRNNFYLLIVLFTFVLRCIQGYEYGNSWQVYLYTFGMLLFLPIISLYSGNAGKKNIFNKWFFYVIYPVHLLVLWAIKYL